MLPRKGHACIGTAPLGWVLMASAILAVSSATDEPPQRSPVHQRIKASLDAVPAIDTHDHLPPRDQMRELVSTPRGRGVNLHSIWQYSYFPWIHNVALWPADGNFDAWWKLQQPNFANAKGTSAYRYLLPAFEDCMGSISMRSHPSRPASSTSRFSTTIRPTTGLKKSSPDGQTSN
ncbi:MAG: hypothetical protein EXR98_23680 [Gemmataceae bacterium]|nr:hypothetical protein [Gemmataceae bacterium]